MGRRRDALTCLMMCSRGGHLKWRCFNVSDHRLHVPQSNSQFMYEAGIKERTESNRLPFEKTKDTKACRLQVKLPVKQPRTHLSTALEIIVCESINGLFFRATAPLQRLPSS